MQSISALGHDLCLLDSLTAHNPSSCRDKATWDDLAVAGDPEGPAYDENTYVLDNQ